MSRRTMNLTDEEIELVLRHREQKQANKERNCIHDFSGSAKVPYGGHVNACRKCGRLQ
jgi:hypothetical protein